MVYLGVPTNSKEATGSDAIGCKSNSGRAVKMSVYSPENVPDVPSKSMVGSDVFPIEIVPFQGTCWFSGVYHIYTSNILHCFQGLQQLDSES